MKPWCHKDAVDLGFKSSLKMKEEGGAEKEQKRPGQPLEDEPRHVPSPEFQEQSEETISADMSGSDANCGARDEEGRENGPILHHSTTDTPQDAANINNSYDSWDEYEFSDEESSEEEAVSHYWVRREAQEPPSTIREVQAAPAQNHSMDVDDLQDQQSAENGSETSEDYNEPLGDPLIQSANDLIASLKEPDRSFCQLRLWFNKHGPFTSTLFPPSSLIFRPNF